MGKTKGKKKNLKSLNRMSKKCAVQIKHSIHAMTSKFIELCNKRNAMKV